MSNMKFEGTKGDWELGQVKVNEITTGKQLVIWSKERPKNEQDQYQMICAISPMDSLTKEDEANAQIMAASKELLKVVRSYHKMATRRTMPTETELEMLSIESKAAINKALKK